MVMTMIEAIAAHRAAWQAFQDAPAGACPQAIAAEDEMAIALDTLLRTVPATRQDFEPLRAHLDWWVVEEVQRREVEPELFALHAAINMSRDAENERCRRLAYKEAKRLGEGDGAVAALEVALAIIEGERP